MSIDEIIQLITAERDRLNMALAALQGTQRPKRRGRPPKNPLAAAPARIQKQGRPRFTKAQREAQAERMRQYWAKRRKQEAKTKKGTKKRTKPAKPSVEASAA